MVSDTPIVDFVQAHWKLSIIILAVCVVVSLCLIARLWVWGVGFASSERSRGRLFCLFRCSAGFSLPYFIAHQNDPRMKVTSNTVVRLLAVGTSDPEASAIIEEATPDASPTI
jgi:hypothetical protein